MNVYRRTELRNFHRYYIQYRCLYYNQRLEDFPLSFKCKDAEQKRYEIWEKNNFFNPSTDSVDTFSMILPPPNVTGILHLGHALTATVQDILARWYRMKGVPVEWVPGFDHAGIATQAVLERHLTKTKNIKRIEMSKTEFMPFLWSWKEEKSYMIRKQLKQLGATLNWSKEFFTMSEVHNNAVTAALLQLNDKGLLYRDKRLINWSPSLSSALSDIEVEYKEIRGKTNLEVPGYKRKIEFGQIYEIAYDVHNSDDKIVVATTRPETIFGDVAIAVHPNDDRYSRFVGKFVKNPLTSELIPVLTDENVKMDFGTGAVKVTPAHNHFDYVIAQKNDLKFSNVIDESGNLTSVAGTFTGLPRFIAKHKIINDMSKTGTLRSAKDHSMLVPVCTRTGDIIEFLLRDQWFIRCQEMSQKAIEVVRNGSLKLNPDIHERLWFEWLGNSRDWCVSRQIWWGHQIPAYKCTLASGDAKWVVGSSEDEARLTCISKFNEDPEKIEQDPDVLDTWFSSSILPFSVMGWPDKTNELDKFYPLSLMETGHDILFFWVARMVMLGLELTGKLPFKEILLHGVLCDGRGKKMSKSSGNIILPENVISGISLENMDKQAKQSFENGILNEANLKRTLSVNSKCYPNGIPECGVDALRYTLVSHNIKERTVNFSDTECEVNKFFGNKIWQASRYTVLMTSEYSVPEPEKLTLIDEWILSRLSCMIDIVNRSLETRSFSKATTAIKQFLYYEFCDYYLEATKVGFKTELPKVSDAHRYTLSLCLEVSLRVLSPFMPYLVDDLYCRLSEKLSMFSKNDSVAQLTFPLSEEFEKYKNEKLERKMDNVIKVIISMRKLVGTVSNKKTEFEVHVVPDNVKDKEFFIENKNMINAVGKSNVIKIIDAQSYNVDRNCIWDTATPFCNVYIVMQDLEILEQIKERIKKKRSQVEKKLEDLIRQKSRPNFASKTDDEKIRVEERIELYKTELHKLPQL